MAHAMQLQLFKPYKLFIPFMFSMASISNFLFSRSLIVLTPFLMDVLVVGFNQASNLFKILELPVIFNTPITLDHLEPVKHAYMKQVPLKLNHSPLWKIVAHK